MKKLFPCLLLILITIFLTACPNGTTDSVTPAAETEDTTLLEPSYIYFGGYDEFPGDDYKKASYWKVDKNNLSDVTQELPIESTNNTSILDMQIVGDDVYTLISGYETSYQSVFKNSELIKTLNDNSEETDAPNFLVYDGKIYLFGDEDIYGQYYANQYLWIIESDGEAAYYDFGTGYYPAGQDILIEDGMIILCGYTWAGAESSITHASVYIGSVTSPEAGFTEYPITSGTTESQSRGMTKDGNTLYICGSIKDNSDKMLAAYWTMDLVTRTITSTITLADTTDFSSFLTDIELDDSTVYTSGYQSTVNGTAYYQLKYWNGTTSADLTDGENGAYINDIHINNGTVFTAGTETEDKSTVGWTKIVRYWVDGQVHDLTDETHDAWLNCIAVE